MEDIAIGEIPKNASEVTRVHLTEYRGWAYLDLRAYALKDGADATPTRKGLTIALNKVDQVIDALRAGQAKAAELGMGGDDNSNGEQG